jgi:hypothetical protein
MGKLWYLIGAMSEAHWHRATQVGFHVLFEDPYRHESAEENAMWDELTAPHNYAALRRLIEYRNYSAGKFVGKTEYGERLDNALLADATARWERQKASSTQELRMDEEMTRLCRLIGALSEAHWDRAAQPGVGAFHVIFENPYRHESAKESAIWDELTSPHNYAALRRLIEHRNAVARQEGAKNEFAARLDEALLADATARWERQKASSTQEARAPSH